MKARIVLGGSGDYLLVLMDYADCEVDIHLWLLTGRADVRIYKRDLEPPHYSMVVWHRLEVPLSDWDLTLAKGLDEQGLGKG